METLSPIRIFINHCEMIVNIAKLRLSTALSSACAYGTYRKLISKSPGHKVYTVNGLFDDMIS